MHKIVNGLDPGERAEFQAVVAKTVEWMLRTGGEKDARTIFGDRLVDAVSAELPHLTVIPGGRS